MKKRSFSLFLLLLIGKVCAAQILRQPVSAVYLNAHAYGRTQQDAFAFLHNQAALAFVQSPVAGVYAEQRFLLSSLGYYKAAVAVPLSKGAIGFHLNYTGFDLYTESEAGFAYARTVGRKAALGIQFNHTAYTIPSYGKDGTVHAEIGLMLYASPHLNIGWHVYNLLGGMFPKTKERIAAVYAMGMGYEVSENVLLTTEMEKEEHLPVNINAGIEYQFEKQFFARAGIASASSILYMGSGVAWSIYRVDLSASFHPQLGLSTGLLFMIAFGKKK